MENKERVLLRLGELEKLLAWPRNVADVVGSCTLTSIEFYEIMDVLYMVDEYIQST